jgi:hypothetical protein
MKHYDFSNHKKTVRNKLNVAEKEFLDDLENLAQKIESKKRKSLASNNNQGCKKQKTNSGSPQKTTNKQNDNSLKSTWKVPLPPKNFRGLILNIEESSLGDADALKVFKAVNIMRQQFHSKCQPYRTIDKVTEADIYLLLTFELAKTILKYSNQRTVESNMTLHQYYGMKAVDIGESYNF